MKLQTLLLACLFCASMSLTAQHQKSVLVEKIEGVSISYAIKNGNSDCVFLIDNRSANSAKLEFDVKLFLSNNESKEIHKKIQVPAFQKQEISVRDKKKKAQAGFQQSLKIKQVEVHNVKFSGL